MERYIKIEPLKNGGHIHSVETKYKHEKGWAVIPDSIAIPDTFPFVNIEVDGQTVTAMTAGTVPGPDLTDIKSAKIAEIKESCESYIYAGTDVTLPDGTIEHFSYTLADQSNISEMFTAIMAGATEYPYHADGEICKIYSKEQIVTIYGTLSLFKTEATTYHNSLKAQVNAMTDTDAINAVKFKETELTGEYLENYASMMTSAKTQLEAVLARIPTDETTTA